jgi:predicted component of type VI protein secretion system
MTVLAFKISRENDHLRTVRLDPLVTYIGRMPENHIVVDDPKASRSHARVVYAEGQFVLEDQESENGVFVNDRRVKKHTLVRGDRIQIGKYTLEVVDADPNAEAARPQGSEEDWGLDQTISLSDEKAAELRERAEKRRIEADQKAKASPKLPSLSFTLTIGGNTLSEKVVFDPPRRRTANDPEGNSVEVIIRIGKWVLEKKIQV